MIADLVVQNAGDGSLVYDLGCSTGTTIALLHKRLERRDIQFIGIDNSESMLAKAKHNIEQLNIANCKLQVRDLNQDCEFPNAGAVILNLVLQFIDPDRRRKLIQAIYEGLLPGAYLILVEKVEIDNPVLNAGFTASYHEFKKRNLYTDAEIARKRESLENVLQPWTLEKNIRMLKESGFAVVQEFFRWFNFCGLVAVKQD